MRNSHDNFIEEPLTLASDCESPGRALTATMQNDPRDRLVQQDVGASDNTRAEEKSFRVESPVSASSQ